MVLREAPQTPTNQGDAVGRTPRTRPPAEQDLIAYRGASGERVRCRLTVTTSPDSAFENVRPRPQDSDVQGQRTPRLVLVSTTQCLLEFDLPRVQDR